MAIAHDLLYLLLNPLLTSPLCWAVLRRDLMSYVSPLILGGVAAAVRRHALAQLRRVFWLQKRAKEINCSSSSSNRRKSDSQVGIHPVLPAPPSVFVRGVFVRGSLR